MEILSLNVRGATFLKNKKLEEFKSVVLQENFPILCLSETWLETEPGDIDGYELVAWRPGYKRTEGSSGRSSGGLAVYRKVKVKDTDTVVQIEEILLEKCEICSEIKEKAMSCESKCSLCEEIESFKRNQPGAPRCLGRWLSSRTSRSDCTCANCIWHTEENSWESNELKCHYDCDEKVCRICRFLLPFKLTYEGEAINVCLVYFPPYDGACKKGYDEEYADLLTREIVSEISQVPFKVMSQHLRFLSGGEEGFMENAIVVGDMNAHTVLTSVFKSASRKSRDQSKENTFGEMLINTCKQNDMKLEILNGSTPSDPDGEFTKVSGSRVDDYALVHKERFRRYDFRVLDIDENYFDHRPIVVKLGGNMEQTKHIVEMRKKLIQVSKKASDKLISAGGIRIQTEIMEKMKSELMTTIEQTFRNIAITIDSTAEQRDQPSVTDQPEQNQNQGGNNVDGEGDNDVEEEENDNVDGEEEEGENENNEGDNEEEDQ